MIKDRYRGMLILVSNDEYSELVSWKNRNIHLTEHYGSAWLDMGDKYIHPIIISENEPEFGDMFFDLTLKTIGEITEEDQKTSGLRKIIVQPKDFTKNFLWNIIGEKVKDGDLLDVTQIYKVDTVSKDLKHTWYRDFEYSISKIDNWNSITVQPPNEMVEVRDGELNVGNATPTYYPFTVEKRPGDENKPYGLRGTVIPSELNWDGGWMIHAENLISPLKGRIKEWRMVKNLNQ